MCQGLFHRSVADTEVQREFRAELPVVLRIKTVNVVSGQPACGRNGGCVGGNSARAQNDARLIPPVFGMVDVPLPVSASPQCAPSKLNVPAGLPSPKLSWRMCNRSYPNLKLCLFFTQVMSSFSVKCFPEC